MKNLKTLSEFYQKRFAYQVPKLNCKPHSDTKIIITIPCFNEERLLHTLQSLKACDKSRFPVEILVIINSSEDSPQQVLTQNRKTLEKAKEWISENNTPHLSFRLLYTPSLPRKHAGVGLARKIVMDEALHCFASIDSDGGIVCLDADCEVAKNYLLTLEKAFVGKVNLANLYFEHSFLADSFDHAKTLNSGIMHYELFLRYYVWCLSFAGYPKAFHTIGSSMAVRASVYARSGGMNRRKAGEDFYFLHKVADLSKPYNITETTVFPSARVSNRVPFGTGKAQEKWLNSSKKTTMTYDTATFLDLKTFFALTESFFIHSKDLDLSFKQIPPTIQAFFSRESFFEKIREIKQKSTNILIFRKHYFAWLDGLKVLKLVHFLRDNFYPEVPIQKASLDLLKLMKVESRDLEVKELLRTYRELDRKRSNI